MEAGGSFGIRPAGMLALDVARLEAGFILLEVDYIGVEKALIPSQKYTPFEISLGWTVDLKKEHFVGCDELRKESERGASRQVVGLEIDWLDYEYLYQQAGLPPQVPLTAWRGECLYTKKHGRWGMLLPAVGHRCSRSTSPLPQSEKPTQKPEPGSIVKSLWNIGARPSTQPWSSSRFRSTTQTCGVRRVSREGAKHAKGKTSLAVFDDR
jgi:hypothetical protein